MRFKPSDYLIGLGDIRRALVFALANLRPADVAGEAVMLAILVIAKQFLRLPAATGLILAFSFAAVYWENPLGRRLLRLLGRMRRRDLIGEALFFILLVGAERYLGWPASSGLLLAVLFAFFFWRRRLRTFAAAALLLLLATPVLLLLGDRLEFSAAVHWGEQASVWSFYFLLSAFFLHAYALLRPQHARAAEPEAQAN